MISPPVGITAAEIWNAIKQGNQTHAKVEFPAQGITLVDEDFDMSTGIVIEDAFNAETNLTPGFSVMKQVQVGVLTSDKTDELDWADEFSLSLGVEINGNTVWTQVGKFQGDRPENATIVDKVTLTAYDRMKWFDISADKFLERMTFPVTVSEIYDNLCSYVGIVGTIQTGLTSNMLSRQFSSAPFEGTGYTCRDILTWIAEAVGVYARINSTGECVLTWFESNISHVVQQNEEFSIEHAEKFDGYIWDEFDDFYWYEANRMTWAMVCGSEEAYNIDSIHVTQCNNDASVSYPNDLGQSPYMIVENPLLVVEEYQDVEDYVIPIYDRLHDFGGHLPVHVECIGDWLVEAGDIISVYISDSEVIEMPIFYRTLRWNGAITAEYETTGTMRREAVSSANKEKLWTRNSIRFFAKDQYYEIQSGIEIVPEGIDIAGSKYINIQSGGSFNVAAGSNIDINGSGNLKLTGSVVEIKSGSTFDVDSENFKIDSTNKTVTTGEWTQQQKGLTSRFTSPYNYGENAIYYGRYENLFEPSNIPTMGIASSIDSNLNTNKYGCTWHHHLRQKNGDYADMHVWMNPDATTPTSGINVVNAVNNAHVDIKSVLGNDFNTWKNKWEICAGAIRYDTISQRSSRDIKHDIRDMESQGEKLDNLRPVTFVYDEDEDERTRYGLIYEEVMETMPDICTQNEEIKAVSYMELVPMLLKEIQDLRKRVAQLEEREV